MKHASLCSSIVQGGGKRRGDGRRAASAPPRDTSAYAWKAFAGYAKLYLGSDEEAAAWLHRAIETNRSYSLQHFALACALAHLGQLDDARAAVQAGLALNPTFTLRRFRAGHSRPSRLAQKSTNDCNSPRADMVRATTGRSSKEEDQ
jgi:tetratricopeptide (TPR) repeat protein